MVLQLMGLNDCWAVLLVPGGQVCLSEAVSEQALSPFPPAV